jgi:hypothetical protein
MENVAPVWDSYIIIATVRSFVNSFQSDFCRKERQPEGRGAVEKVSSQIFRLW